VVERIPESKLWKNIQAGKFQVSVEIDPPKGIALDRVYETSRKNHGFRQSRCHRHQFRRHGSRRHGRFNCRRCSEARGVETIPHLTTRDQNIIGLQAALLGAWTVAACATFWLSPRPTFVGDHPETAASTKSIPSVWSKFFTASIRALTGPARLLAAPPISPSRRRQSGFRPISMKRLPASTPKSKPARTSP